MLVLVGLRVLRISSIRGLRTIQELARDGIMALEPNMNEIAAKVIQGQISNAIGALTKGVRISVGKILEVISKDLTKYTEVKKHKCSYIRTPIINRDHATHIYDIYVKTRLKVRKAVEADDDFIANLADNDSIVIAGNAGSGKSMFMRHLFLELCSAKRKKIPLFFELRDLNASEKKNLQEFLYYNLIGANATITESQFYDSLKAGVYSLILDGFDEINFEDRQGIEGQIRRLRDQCPDLQIIISSRPDADRRFESWQSFKVIDVEPMTMEQAAELIDKLDYDAKVKSKFLKAARDTLFKTHQTFLSNPLLCIMMLVTFEQTGHIPTKRHVFYEKAFDALFSIHDTAKEGVYKRKTYSNLSVDDFRNCMAAFCIVSYLKEQFVFTRAAFRDSLQKALQLQNLNTNIDDLTSDMIESTCLIQVEGTDYVFTHRSFQEYFAAVFISRSPALGVGALLDNVSRRASDDVISLTFAINKGVVERDWIIPTLEKIVANLPTSTKAAEGLEFVSSHVGGILVQVSKEAVRSINFFFNENGVKLFAIMRLYMFVGATPKIEGLFWRTTKDDLKVVTEAYQKLAEKKDPRVSPAKYGTKQAAVNFMFDLTHDDLEWLERTTFASSMARIQRSIRQVLSTAKSEAKDQEDILSKLSGISLGA